MANTRNPYKELDGKLNITGNIIHKIRLEKGLSAQQLSDKLIIIGLDIHRQAIYDIESGKRTVSDYELGAIAEMLDTDSNTLLKKYTDFVKREKQ